MKFLSQEVEADLYRYGGLTGLKGFLKGLKIPGFRYVFLFRMASKGARYSIKRIIFSRIKNYYSFKYGFQITIYTKIDIGLYIGHFGHLVINDKAKIGKNCTLGPGITIGQANRGKLKGYPTISDNVFIGTGAVVVGNILIGSNVLIAPNSFVNVNVPSNSMVIGNPCKIIPNDNPCKGYIMFPIDEII